MKVLLIILLAFTSATAEAASLEDSYLAARNRYITKFKKLEQSGQDGDALSKQEEQALSDLGQQLQRIIGQVAIKGFSSQGKINIDTLSSGDVGFGQLDGLAYSSQAGKEQLVVTTETLLRDWLRAHKNWWEKQKNAPQKVEDALRSEPFYTQAISSDAAVFKYAEVPVNKPASAQFVVAILDARSQDMGPRTPDELIVSLVQGGKVFIATEPVKTKIDPIPACDAIAKEAQSKSDKAQADYAASGLKNEKLFDESTHLREQGDRDFRKCFGEHARHEGFFAALTEQAQALVERLTSR
jgi:hypothetical protein